MIVQFSESARLHWKRPEQLLTSSSSSLENRIQNGAVGITAEINRIIVLQDLIGRESIHLTDICE